MKIRTAKKMRKNLINKKALQYIIANSKLCHHAKDELKLAGYGNGEGGPNDWMYEQVMEAIGVFSSHGNSGASAPFEIHLVQKLCSWDIISPLRFTDDEWNIISEDGTCQNRRKSDVFKEPDGNIHYNGAFKKRPIKRYSYSTKEWSDNKNPLCWHGGLFEHKDGVLTGRYFSRCLLHFYDIEKGWKPKESKILDCVEVEIAPDNWIMAVQEDSIDLLTLSYDYKIDWKECPIMKGIRLEDITPKVEDIAYREMQNGNGQAKEE